MVAYKVLNWRQPVGLGINQATEVQVAAVAKCDNEKSPYLLANQLVAGRPGQYLGLPGRAFCVSANWENGGRAREVEGQRPKAGVGS